MKKLVTSVLALFAVCVMALGENAVTELYDSSEIIRIKYTGTNSTATAAFTTTGGKLTLTASDLGGTPLTILSGSTTGTVGHLIAQVNLKGTNSAHAQIFSASLWNALTGDVSSGYVGNASTTLTKGRWHTIGAWDTSAILHYDVCLNWMNGNNEEAPSTLARIYGEPDGTGDLTVRLYEDGAIKWKKFYESPLYLQPQYPQGGGQGTNTALNAVDITQEINFPLDSNKHYFLRATRATTATTGEIGAIGRD